MAKFAVIVRNVQTWEYKYVVECGTEEEAAVIAKARHANGNEADDSWMLYDTEYVDHVTEEK